MQVGEVERRILARCWKGQLQQLEGQGNKSQVLHAPALRALGPQSTLKGIHLAWKSQMRNRQPAGKPQALVGLLQKLQASSACSPNPNAAPKGASLATLTAVLMACWAAGRAAVARSLPLRCSISFRVCALV